MDLDFNIDDGRAKIQLDRSMRIVKARQERAENQIAQHNLNVAASVHYLNKELKSPPKVAVILGTGLGGVADLITADKKIIPYENLPGWPIPTAPGHAGKIVAGKVSGIDVLFLQGRKHLYEGEGPEGTSIMTHTLRALGVETEIITSAVGSFNPKRTPGNLVSIVDHYGAPGMDPLMGPNNDFWGPRFTAMNNVWNVEVGSRLINEAAKVGVDVGRGVFCYHPGPCFESPAEISRFRGWLNNYNNDKLRGLTVDAHVCGMSMVPEGIFAAHCQPAFSEGEKEKQYKFCHKRWTVLGLAAITNLASDINPTPPSDEETREGAKLCLNNMKKTIEAYIVNVVAKDYQLN